MSSLMLKDQGIRLRHCSQLTTRITPQCQRMPFPIRKQRMMRTIRRTVMMSNLTIQTMMFQTRRWATKLKFQKALLSHRERHHEAQPRQRLLLLHHVKILSQDKCLQLGDSAEISEIAGLGNEEGAQHDTPPNQATV